MTGQTETVIGGTSPWFEHFSKTATANYNELGNSFPELLRLAELAKLTAIALVFQYHYRALHRVVLPPTIEVRDFSSFRISFIVFILQTIGNLLNSSNLRGQVFGGRWPLVTDERIEQILDESLVEQGIGLSRKHLVRNLAEFRAHIRQQLTTTQNNQIIEIARFLSTEFNISLDRISGAAISSYLANSHSNAEKPLLNEIVSGNARFVCSSSVKLICKNSKSCCTINALIFSHSDFDQIQKLNGLMIYRYLTAYQKFSAKCNTSL